MVLPLTSDITDITQFRTLVTPSAANGLRVESHVMIDKITNVRRDRVGGVIGVVDENIAIDVTRKLAVFLGLG